VTAPQPLAILTLTRDAALWLWPGGYVETRWKDGRVTGATRPESPENIAQAAEQGYTGPHACWRSLCDHEAAHSITADVLWGSHSPALRHESTGGDPDAPPERYALALRYYEEGIVLAMQRYVTTGEVTTPIVPLTVPVRDEIVRRLRRVLPADLPVAVLTRRAA